MAVVPEGPAEDFSSRLRRVLAKAARKPVAAGPRDIHTGADKPWTVQQPGRIARMPRTAFTEEFTALVGYSTEFAFGSVFRPGYGIPPGRLRTMPTSHSGSTKLDEARRSSTKPDQAPRRYFQQNMVAF
ncbi:hypothetical protein OIE63_28600 [Streptomyces sp. NBC_01795]|uniref:hypothetical protein n=1 Tax=unclassified Streptomyces TaxID=2593676 RepID=UPI002DDC02FC|nr:MULTISPECIES: hypothetical protein [unclassified Streptomyces]WSA95071.1 hypothetical protein OIE63_28600 [Streptomyces sp. NBC_01795]WSS12304.1 hypothetical protein OG533_10500 [Streptomyces sp. NBC_01186]